MTPSISIPDRDEPALLERLRSALAGPPAGELDATFAERFPLTILVVEDNKLNLKVAQGLLARLGYSSDSATNGVEAIQATARKRYDVVLMDVQMPVMDGLAATRQIRARFGDAAPRVIAMTAAEGADEQRQCAAVGMSGLVAKPVRVDTLAAALAGGGERASREALDLAVLDARVACVGEPDVRVELATLLGRAEAAAARIVRACDEGHSAGAAAACAELDSSATRVGAIALAAAARELGRCLAAGVGGVERAAAARALSDAARAAQALAVVVLDAAPLPTPST